MDNKYKLNWFNEIDSTSAEALRQINISTDKTIWFAEFQTAGRGQRGNSWESAIGKNLTFTILIKPKRIKPQNQFIISEFISIALCNYLKHKGLNPKIKWPNDIYLDDKKICGILIEHSIIGDKLSASVIGIGFNLNQIEFASDAPNPTSLSIQTGATYDLEVELKKLLEEIFSLYDRLNADEDNIFNEIDAKYYSLLYRLGIKSKFVDLSLGKEFDGIIMGVDEFACIRVKNNEGEVRSYAFKEISYII